VIHPWRESDVGIEPMKICWFALQKDSTEGKIDLETHYLSILLVKDVEGGTYNHAYWLIHS